MPAFPSRRATSRAEVASAAAMAMMIFYTNVGARMLHAALARALDRRTQAWRRR